MSGFDLELMDRKVSERIAVLERLLEQYRETDIADLFAFVGYVQDYAQLNGKSEDVAEAVQEAEDSVDFEGWEQWLEAVENDIEELKISIDEDRIGVVNGYIREAKARVKGAKKARRVLENAQRELGATRLELSQASELASVIREAKEEAEEYERNKFRTPLRQSNY